MTIIVELAIVLSIIYTAGVLVLYKGLKRAVNSTLSDTMADEKLPPITIIVPTRNEIGNIDNIISDLKKQNYPEDKIEILIIDDFSTDGTAERALELVGDDTRFNILRLSQQSDFLEKSKLTAKKRVVDFGVRTSSSEIVLFTDADCRLKPNWARSMASQFSGGYSVVAGFVGFHIDSTLQGILALESLATRIIGAGMIGMGNAITCPGGNLAYKKDIYFNIGGLDNFNKTFSGDDTLFIQTAVSKGARAMFNFNEDSFVYTVERGGIRDVVIRRIRRLGITPQFKLDMLLSSGLLFLYCFLLALTPFILFIKASMGLVMIILWILKYAVDFWILRKGAGLFNESRLLKYLPPTGFLYPYYITVVGALSLFIKGGWKGR